MTACPMGCTNVPVCVNLGMDDSQTTHRTGWVPSGRALPSSGATWKPVPLRYAVSTCIRDVNATFPRWLKRDFIDLWPALAGDKDTLCEGIICNAIQNIHPLSIWGACSCVLQEAVQKKPANNLATLRINLRNALFVPYVCPNQAVDILELVQEMDVLGSVAHSDSPILFLCLGIHEVQVWTRVTAHKLSRTVCEAPSVLHWGICYPPLLHHDIVRQSKRFPFIYQCFVCLPEQLNQIVPPKRKAFPKLVSLVGEGFNDIAGGQVKPTNIRFSPHPVAFIHGVIAEIEDTLRESIGVVWVLVHYLVRENLGLPS
mmetsp:Transcript_13418/g.48835  ORF Transcript_13418/g.48835 Transcript_13418/m.48835 type:complete len:314 (+) Transcript_13418:1638-2579(+)